MHLLQQEDSDGHYETIKKGDSKYFPPGTVRSLRVVLAWKDAAHIKCHNGVFCTQIELTITDQTQGMRMCDHPNFANQLAFTDMQIGAAFFYNGAPHSQCPEQVVQQCKSVAPWCRTTQGKFDKCMHTLDACTEEVGFKVQVAQCLHQQRGKCKVENAHYYCLSPDVNKASISDHMVNPSKKACAEPMKSERWLCRGNCKDMQKTTTGTSFSLCSPRWDIVHLIENPLENLTLLNAHAGGAPLTRDDLIHKTELGGAKLYQSAVNLACGNQAPTCRAQTSHGKIIEENVAYDRCFDKTGHLDHAITYEADDANRWELKDQTYANRGLFMSGSDGMQCSAGKTWDTFVIKACPNSGD